MTNSFNSFLVGLCNIGTRSMMRSEVVQEESSGKRNPVKTFSANWLDELSV